jgi:hypothetical protein
MSLITEIIKLNMLSPEAIAFIDGRIEQHSIKKETK